MMMKFKVLLAERNPTNPLISVFSYSAGAAAGKQKCRCFRCTARFAKHAVSLLERKRTSDINDFPDSHFI